MIQGLSRPVQYQEENKKDRNDGRSPISAGSRSGCATQVCPIIEVRAGYEVYSSAATSGLYSYLVLWRGPTPEGPDHVGYSHNENVLYPCPWGGNTPHGHGYEYEYVRPYVARNAGKPSGHVSQGRPWSPDPYGKNLSRGAWAGAILPSRKVTI